MLPDPGKVYGDDEIVAGLWKQFTVALQRAKAVLVLGHSLNDRSLVEAIVANVEPLDRVGVTLLADASNPREPDPSADSVFKVAQEYLGKAERIPLRFGSTDEVAVMGLANVRAWMEQLADKGLIDR